MSEKINTDWIKDGLLTFEDDDEWEDEIKDYLNMRKESRKSSFDYFIKGLEELIREWEEWKIQED